MGSRQEIISQESTFRRVLGGWQRIRNIMRKEFLQLSRDTKLYPLIFIPPFIDLFFLGYAASIDVKNIPLAVFDNNRSAESREFARAFTSTNFFMSAGHIESYDEAQAVLRQGKAAMILVIPPVFWRRSCWCVIRNRRRPQMLVDGSDSNVATLGLAHATMIAQSFSALLIEKQVHAAAAGALAETLIEPQVRVWFNPALKSRNYMVPGVIALILIESTMIFVALALVKEKELGTMEQIIVTPIAPSELLIGKLIPYGVMGFVEISIALLAGVNLFEVPMAGNVLLLLSLALAFILSTVGMGLFISVLSRTQFQAMIIAFFVMMPMILFSGFMFPIENMPEFFQTITNFIPARYFLEILRGIFLRGAGIDLLWPQAVVLLGMGGLIFAASLLSFKKEVV